jgi:hypothetical protein
VLGESDEFRKLRRAIEKAHGDRDRAIRNVCCLYGVKTIDALPGAVRAATLEENADSLLRVTGLRELRCYILRTGSSYHRQGRSRASARFRAHANQFWTPPERP